MTKEVGGLTVSGMAALVARSSSEVDALRAAANLAAGQSPYRATVATAVLVTLDWLAGATEVAPASGGVLEPTPENVQRELVRAEDEEAEARRAGRPSTAAGVVGQTLSWFRCDDYTEPPLY